MKVGRLYREKIVKTIQTGIESKKNAFVVNYRNLPSSNVSTLRKALQHKQAKMYLSRGTLAKIALKGSVLASVIDSLEGHTAFVWTDADAVEISKALVKFADKNETFVVRGGVISGSFLNKEDVKRLSDLPSKEVLLAKIVGALKAPTSRIARTFTGKQTELILLLKQISEKKGGK